MEAPGVPDVLDQPSRELDRERRRQILRKLEEFLFTIEDPYLTGPWVPWFYFVSDKAKTEVGPLVVPETIQTVLKWEYGWLAR